MARPTTAQPVTFTLRTLAVVVATAVSGMSVYAQAATTSKEETITVTTAAPQENAWGPAATIAALPADEPQVVEAVFQGLRVT